MDIYENGNLNGYLKLIIGCMFSGKTTELIKEFDKWNACNFKCIMINHISDKRYSEKENETQSHSGIKVNSTNVGDNLMQHFSGSTQKDDILSYDVIFINEGQFFTDLYDFVDYLVNSNNKRVYVCGLDGDFQRKKFGSILDIIPLCDEVKKYTAICGNCKQKYGIFTYRISDEKEQKVIGSSNYMPVCRKCYNMLNKNSGRNN